MGAAASLSISIAESTVLFDTMLNPAVNDNAVLRATSVRLSANRSVMTIFTVGVSFVVGLPTRPAWMVLVAPALISLYKSLRR